MFKKINAKGTYSPDGALIDSGNRIVTASMAQSATLNITTPTLVKAGPGYVVAVAVIVAGTLPGTVNDAASTGAAAPANQVAVIPNTVGQVGVNFPVAAGIVVVPGTGQTLAVTFN